MRTVLPLPLLLLHSHLQGDGGTAIDCTCFLCETSCSHIAGRGLCSHALWKGCLLPFGAPRFTRSSAWPHCTCMGAFPFGPHSMPTREWREGACHAGWVSTPSSHPLVLTRMCATFCAPHSLGQGGSTRGEVPSLRWRPTPQPGASLAWVSRTQGAGVVPRACVCALLGCE